MSPDIGTVASAYDREAAARPIPAEPATSSMAIRNLCVMAYAQGFTLWSYRAMAHTVAQVTAPGYMNDAVDMMNEGDHVHLVCRDGGSLAVVNRIGRNLTLTIMCGRPAMTPAEVLDAVATAARYIEQPNRSEVLPDGRIRSEKITSAGEFNAMSEQLRRALRHLRSAATEAA